MDYITKKIYLVEENLRQSKFVLTVMDNGIISRVSEAIGSGPRRLIELQNLEIWNKRPSSVLLSWELREKIYKSNQATFYSLPYYLVWTKCHTQLSYLKICTADDKQTWRSFSRYYRVDFDLKKMFADHYFLYLFYQLLTQRLSQYSH